MYKTTPQLRLVVILVVLTRGTFRFTFFISYLLAKAIPVRGAKFRKAHSGLPAWAFLFCNRKVSRPCVGIFTLITR
ncbi:hypothetical protein [Yersinia rohdei]|uniref:hypothetical protein n=1 Tax=Yersinia rohdei TaxID=29485 RepID=UPI0025AA6707|nr:hypothetical protein [Yersinia rohdei]MDN0096496.1 hypothetical protein [Yersinia rohdei]